MFRVISNLQVVEVKCRDCSGTGIYSDANTTEPCECCSGEGVRQVEIEADDSDEPEWMDRYGID